MGTRFLTLGVPGGGETWPLNIRTFSQTISATNLIANPGMEDGDPPTGWTASGTGAEVHSAAEERTGGAGSKSLQVLRNGDDTTPEGVTGNITYSGWLVFGIWMRRVDATYAQLTGQSGTYLQNAAKASYTGATWKQFETLLQAYTNFKLLCSQFSSSTGLYSLFDDVSAYAITPNTDAVLPSADAEIEVTLSLPTANTYPGQCLMIAYRATAPLVGSLNWWDVLIYRNDGNTNWDLTLNTVVNKVRTVRVTATGIGSPTKIKIACNGTQHRCYSLVGSDWVPLYDVYDLSHNDTATGLNTVYSTLTMAPVSLRARASSPFESGLTGGSGLLFLDGDSKTDPTSSYGFWDFMLEYLLERSTSKDWDYYNIAQAGATLATGLAALSAALAALAASPEPDYALINFGANDVEGALVEATWKANLRTYIETVHAKWATTPIYFMLPWREGYDVNSALLKTWITAVVAEYNYAFVGPDESVWFAVDETLWYSGGTHYSRIGDQYCAINWRNLLI